MMRPSKIDLTRKMTEDTKNMSLREFINYNRFDPSLEPCVIEAYRLFFLDEALFRDYMKQYLFRVCFADNVIVINKNSHLLSIPLTNMYRNSECKIHTRICIAQRGYKCMHVTPFGLLELANMDSDIDMLVNDLKIKMSKDSVK